MTPLYDDVIAINDFKLIKKIINKGEIKKNSLHDLFPKEPKERKKNKMN